MSEFLAFPWGRESFLKLINTARPGKKVPGKIDDPIATFLGNCQQQTYRLQGFTLSLQLLAFICISGMLNKVPNHRDERTLLQLPFIGETNKTKIEIKDVLDVEWNPNLVVKPLLEIEQGRLQGSAEWDDEVRDKKVLHLEELIKQDHVFKKSDWI